jgi:hypothetical protein
MGIFKEDLLNLGNLIGTEFEARLTSREFAEVHPGLEFVFENGLLKIRGVRRFLLLKRSFEFRGREDPERVYTDRDLETKDLGVMVRVVSWEGSEEILRREGFRREGEYLRMSLLPVLKRTDVYRDIPDTFRDRLKATRYRIREGYLSLFLTVTK